MAFIRHNISELLYSLRFANTNQSFYAKETASNSHYAIVNDKSFEGLHYNSFWVNIIEYNMLYIWILKSEALFIGVD